VFAFRSAAPPNRLSRTRKKRSDGPHQRSQQLDPLWPVHRVPCARSSCFQLIGPQPVQCQCRKRALDVEHHERNHHSRREPRTPRTHHHHPPLCATCTRHRLSGAACWDQGARATQHQAHPMHHLRTERAFREPLFRRGRWVRRNRVCLQLRWRCQRVVRGWLRRIRCRRGLEHRRRGAQCT
jgi:hypothetical protein